MQEEEGDGGGAVASLLLVVSSGDHFEVQLGAQVHVHGGWCVACCSPGDLDLVWFWL